MSTYSELPRQASIETTAFSVSIPQDDINDLMTLVRLSKLGPRTYENTSANGKYGLMYDWMSEMKDHWETSFDWRSVENRINAFSQFKSKVIDDDGSTFDIHFVGLFSQRKDAIPVMFIHGWPGSFMEFLGVLTSLQNKYTPNELPYHVVVPSLPGYAFSAPPPLEKDWKLQDSARLLHKLMVGLGFDSGYAVQGGDIGSYTGRIMAKHYDACKALHLNFCAVPFRDEEAYGSWPIQDYEWKGLERADHFAKFEAAYSLKHATRPATIGFTLASNPMALLAWVGEKFLTWSDTTPSTDEILASVSLYWLTESFPRSIYSYRQEVVENPDEPKTKEFYSNILQKGPDRYMFHDDPEYYCHKPLGYSWFPAEIVPIPRAWVARTGDLRWANHHQKGGHFAALEQPDALLADVEAFLEKVWA